MKLREKDKIYGEGLNIGTEIAEGLNREDKIQAKKDLVKAYEVLFERHNRWISNTHFTSVKGYIENKGFKLYAYWEIDWIDGILQGFLSTINL